MGTDREKETGQAFDSASTQVRLPPAYGTGQKERP